jgi:hypothetical protein
MIKFFRKIRKNLLSEGKTSKYFKYAIGEIVLVIIGILIALQINNWNEIRKSNKIEKEFLTNIYKDLVTDSIQFAYYNQQYQSIEKLHKQLYEIGVNNIVLDTINETTLIRRSLYFKQLINKDFKENAYSISNKNVREALINYTQIIADMENAYNQQLEPIIANVVKPLLASAKVYNAKNWFQIKQKNFTDNLFQGLNGSNVVDKDKLITLSKTEAFQQMLIEVNMKWAEFHSRLLPVIEENNSLKILIKNELSNY